MKLNKQIIDGVEVYFKDGVKKYEHYYSSDFGERWSEYDKQGNEIHYKNSRGDEWWSDKHPDKPKIKSEEVNIEPFTFKTKWN